MKRVLFLFLILVAIYLAIVILFPMSPSNFSDYFNAYNSLDLQNYSSKNFDESENRYCYSLPNNGILTTRKFLIPLFRGIDYQITVKAKSSNYDTNAFLVFSLKNKPLCTIPITNTVWKNSKKPISVQKNTYGFGYGTPNLDIKCLCSNGNKIDIASFDISCQPFYKTIINRISNKSNSSENSPKGAPDIKNNYKSSLIKNGCFTNHFSSWDSKDNVILTNIDQFTCAYLKCLDGKRKRFSQNVNVISGEVYVLKFDLSSKTDGAYINLRDMKTGFEQYYWLKANKSKRSYKWEFVPRMTGKSTVYFTAEGKGEYFFSNISLYQINSRLRIFFETLIILFTIMLFGGIFYYISKK